jgi:hypothetical protein
MHSIKEEMQSYFGRGVFQFKEARLNISGYNKSVNHKLLKEGFLKVYSVKRTPAKTRTRYWINKDFL